MAWERETASRGETGPEPTNEGRFRAPLPAANYYRMLARAHQSLDP